MVACPKFVRPTITWQCGILSSATSGWSLQVNVYAELIVAFVGIEFVYENSRIVALTFHMRTKQKVHESKTKLGNSSIYFIKKTI